MGATGEVKAGLPSLLLLLCGDSCLASSSSPVLMVVVSAPSVLPSARNLLRLTRDKGRAEAELGEGKSEILEAVGAEEDSKNILNSDAGKEGGEEWRNGRSATKQLMLQPSYPFRLPVS